MILLSPIPGSLEVITSTKVKPVITAMKNGKATGPNKIPAELCEKAGVYGVKWLTNLFNFILSKGTICGV